MSTNLQAYFILCHDTFSFTLLLFLSRHTQKSRISQKHLSEHNDGQQSQVVKSDITVSKVSWTTHTRISLTLSLILILCSCFICSIIIIDKRSLRSDQKSKLRPNQEISQNKSPKHSRPELFGCQIKHRALSRTMWHKI